jgi:opacity protein-like surface antigen
MNKNPILVSVFIFLSSTVFSLDLSTGYGLILGGNFDTLGSELNLNATSSKQIYNQFNFGGLIFFDAKYIAVDISFYGNLTTFGYNNTLKAYTMVNENYQLAGSNLAFGLYAKYPFTLDNKLSIFPILGMQGSIGLSQNFMRDFGARNAKKGESYGNAKDWSNFAIKFGAGLDIKMSGIIFLRAELLGNYRFNTALDEAFLDAIKNGGYPATYNINMGFEASFSIGYIIGETSKVVSPDAFTNSDTNNDGDIYYPRMNPPLVE